MHAGLIREQESQITGPVRTMHLTEQGRAALTPREILCPRAQRKRRNWRSISHRSADAFPRLDYTRRVATYRRTRGFRSDFAGLSVLVYRCRCSYLRGDHKP